LGEGGGPLCLPADPAGPDSEPYPLPLVAGRMLREWIRGISYHKYPTAAKAAVGAPEKPFHNSDLATLCCKANVRALSSTPAILRETRLRMRLWTSRGSCPCPWRFIWGWSPKVAQHLGGGDLPDTPSTEGAGPHLRESCPSRRERPRKDMERGPARIELRWIPGNHRINPARRGGEGGLQGVERYAAGIGGLQSCPCSWTERGGRGQEGPAKRVTPRLVECARW